MVQIEAPVLEMTMGKTDSISLAGTTHALPSSSVAEDHDGDALPRRLAEALLSLTDADQVLLGFVDASGVFCERARVLSPVGAQCDWSSWPDVNTLLSQCAIGKPSKEEDGNGSCEKDGSCPGSLLVVRCANGVNGTVLATLYRTPGKPPFTSRERQLAEALLPILSYEPVGNEIQLLLQVRLLTQIAQVGGSNPDLSYTLRFAMRELARHCPGCLTSVWLLDDRHATTLHLTVSSEATGTRRTGLSGSSHNGTASLLGKQILADHTPLLPVLERKQIVYVGNLAAQPSEVLRHWSDLGFRCCVAVPLFVGQAKVGLLLLLSQRSNGLTKNEVHLAATVAELLGPIIACHRLNEQLGRAYEQLQKAQQQLIHAEKMRALGELASGMAHDFNNALCGTLGFIELALKDPQLPPNIEELLRMARTCALDAAATVRRVQDFARWDRSLQNAELVQVNDLVRQVVELTRPRWHNAARADCRVIDVQLDLQAQVPVMANPAELREVLTNLILNAVDAMPHGGTIRIATANDSENVFIEVADTGIGMTPEVQKRLFEPFFTTKKERGTGLGLSVSYAIVKRHGGQISVRSEVGRGSTFTIQLPIVRTIQPSTSSTAATVKSPASLRILVVDDEPHVLSFLRQCLLHLGHHPDTANDAEQALEQFRRGTYDVVITDLGMPKLDGRELAARIHELAPNVPVILLTGWGDQIKSEDRPLGVCRVLAKPVTVEQLAAVLQDQMDTRVAI